MVRPQLSIALVACFALIGCDPEDGSTSSSDAQTSIDETPWSFSLEGNPVQGFYCTAQGAPFGYLIFNDQGGIEVRPEGGIPFSATYQISGEGWLIEAAPIGFSETTTALEPHLGMVGRFTTPTLSCHAVGWAIDQTLSGRYQCPPIKYIEGVSYEDNLFEFGPNGDVFRSNRTERLTGNGDTLFNRTHGIYRLYEDRVYLYFGDSTIERDLNAQVMAGAWISVDQLNPEAGQCTLTD